MLQRLYDRANGVSTPPSANDDKKGDRQHQELPGSEDRDQEYPVAGETLLEDYFESELRKIGSSVPTADIYDGLNYLTKGEELPEYVVGSVASHMGIEPGQAAQTIETLRGLFESQAINAVSDYGVDAYELFAWARENKPQELQRAITNHTHQRTVEGYKGIAQDYMLNLDKIDPQAIINANFGDGISARISGNGPGSSVVLSTPTGDVSWQNAVRLGYIKIAKNHR